MSEGELSDGGGEGIQAVVPFAVPLCAEAPQHLARLE
jgi:hypothetical protein